MFNTCVPSLSVISTTINQFETNALLTTICCLRLFVVVIVSQKMVSETCLPSVIIIDNTIKQLEINVLL